MVRILGKKRSTFTPSELASLDDAVTDYWHKSRNLESETVVDLEKHLWLANAAAATISIGFIQGEGAVSDWQYWGSWSFVSGIVFLVFMKFVSAWTSSRDRFRFEAAKMKFDSDDATDEVFGEIRDAKFRALKLTYSVLQWGAGLAFVGGLVLTLFGAKDAA